MRAVFLASSGAVLAAASYNNPNTPGNWNLPTDAGFGANLAGGLPEINVRYQYRYPAGSFLSKGQAELDMSNSMIAIQDVQNDAGADTMLLGLAHSPRPHRSSFLKGTDPLEILPAGVAGGIAAAAADETPYTLVLHAPEEGIASTNGLVDSLARSEAGIEHGIEAAAVAEKQKLLESEIMKVDDLVANARRHSFLKSLGFARKADYTVTLHAPAESSSDINAAVASILKTETAKAQSAASSDKSLKSSLLSAEISKIGRIVRGASASFLEPFVPPIAVQTSQQASLPNTISIDYDVPKSFLSRNDQQDVYFEANPEAPESALKWYLGSSFLGAHGDEIPRSMPVLNIDVPVRTQ